MKFIEEFTGKAMLGLGLSLQTAEARPALDVLQPQTTLVLEEDGVETPALPAMIPIELNRSERRFLRLPATHYVPAETPDYDEVLSSVEQARKSIKNRHDLIRYGRQMIR